MYRCRVMKDDIGRWSKWLPYYVSDIKCWNYTIPKNNFFFTNNPRKACYSKIGKKYCLQPSFPQSQKWILVSLILSVYPRVFNANFEQARLNTRFLLHKIKESFAYLPIFSRLLVALETTCNSDIFILILIIKQRKFSKENLIVRESHSLL